MSTPSFREGLPHAMLAAAPLTHKVKAEGPIIMSSVKWESQATRTFDGLPELALWAPSLGSLWVLAAQSLGLLGHLEAEHRARARGDPRSGFLCSLPIQVPPQHQLDTPSRI